MYDRKTIILLYIFNIMERQMRAKNITKNDLATAKRLENLRKSLGYSQEKMSNEMGMSVSAYQNLESGFNKISTRVLRILYEKFQISSDYILFGKTYGNTEFFVEFQGFEPNKKAELIFKLVQEGCGMSLEEILK